MGGGGEEDHCDGAHRLSISHLSSPLSLPVYAVHRMDRDEDMPGQSAQTLLTRLGVQNLAIDHPFPPDVDARRGEDFDRETRDDRDTRSTTRDVKDRGDDRRDDDRRREHVCLLTPQYSNPGNEKAEILNKPLHIAPSSQESLPNEISP